jgi:hypothetical protein
VHGDVGTQSLRSPSQGRRLLLWRYHFPNRTAHSEQNNVNNSAVHDALIPARLVRFLKKRHYASLSGRSWSSTHLVSFRVFTSLGRLVS